LKNAHLRSVTTIFHSVCSFFFNFFLFDKVFCLYIPALTNLSSILPTYLNTAFTTVAPKSVRIQSSCQYLFTLSGSASVKAVCRTLMKSIPGRHSPHVTTSIINEVTGTISCNIFGMSDFLDNNCTLGYF